MSKFNILVVDDEADLAEIMAETLEMEGFSTVQCLDGQKALEIFDTQEFHCILSDSNMPGLKGLELLEKLKEKSKPGESFLFYLCTGDIEFNEAELKDLGIKRLLLKPYDLFSVIELIQSDLDEHFKG